MQGRSDPDWMLVDASNMFVQIMSASSREALQLEDHWRGMKPGQVVVVDVIVAVDAFVIGMV